MRLTVADTRPIKLVARRARRPVQVETPLRGGCASAGRLLLSLYQQKNPARVAPDEVSDSRSQSFGATETSHVTPFRQGNALVPKSST